MSTLTVETVEEKVDVLDRKQAQRGSKTPTNKEYFMRFVCAAMSSTCGWIQCHVRNGC